MLTLPGHIHNVSALKNKQFCFIVKLYILLMFKLKYCVDNMNKTVRGALFLELLIFQIVSCNNGVVMTYSQQGTNHIQQRNEKTTL